MPRTRAARRVRTLLRMGRLVFLRHPRWADVAGFLDDVALDLEAADPPMATARLDLGDPWLREPPAAWARMLTIIADRVGAPLPTAASWPVAREGFRFGLASVLQSAADGPDRVVFAVGAHRLPLDMLEDLTHQWAEWANEQAGGPKIRLLLAARADVGAACPPGAVTVDLPDYSPPEALRWLTGYVGISRRPVLERIIEQTDGLPELLRQIVASGAALGPEAVAKAPLALGPLRGPFEEVLRIVRADDALSERFETLAEGPVPWEAVTDDRIERAGLIRKEGPPRRPVARLRSPILGRLGSP